MKTKITLLLVVLSLSLTSCIKDFYGHPDDKNGILTETNYIYSDDFKAQFLTLQIAELEKEIKELSAKVEADQENLEAAAMLEKALKEQGEASESATVISANRELVYKRRPPIPGPCPVIKNCFPNVQYIALPPGLEYYFLQFIGTNDELIGQTEGSPQALGNVDGLLDYVVFISNKPDYVGEVTIVIQEKFFNDEEPSFIKLESSIGQ